MQSGPSWSCVNNPVVHAANRPLARRGHVEAPVDVVQLAQHMQLGRAEDRSKDRVAQVDAPAPVRARSSSGRVGGAGGGA